MYDQITLEEPLFSVKSINFVSVIRNKDYTHSFKNGRYSYGFIYIIKGKMRDDFFGKTIKSVELSEGDLIFIPKGCSYSGHYLEDNTEIKILQFDIITDTLPHFLLSPVKIDLSDSTENFESFFKNISSNIHQPLYCISNIYKLLWVIESKNRDIPKKYRKLKPALKELREHFIHNHPIDYYASMCNMSEVNFRRLFKEYTSKSPIEYRNDLRLEYARAGILSGEYNVSEAAENSGFSNLSYFILLYKRKYGRTPKAE
ncbi:MAG: helix-turn-helix domain-containing protein [Clostridia bacterium]|nr:helix-turn-helix domain-containing protein [Clostridia bacterium]